jgi:hypothetical protein
VAIADNSKSFVPGRWGAIPPRHRVLAGPCLHWGIYKQPVAVGAHTHTGVAGHVCTGAPPRLSTMHNAVPANNSLAASRAAAGQPLFEFERGI